MIKIKFAGLGLAALLLFAGCGGENGAVTTESPAQTTIGTAQPAETTAPAKETVYRNGSYTGIGYGNKNGVTQVKIEISEDRIVKLEIVGHNDTEDYFDKAWDGIYAAVMGQESPDLSQVDTVSGATNSSNGIIDAIQAALYKARR